MSRILVVEDNPSHLKLVTYLLRKAGFEVDIAEDGEEGVRLACATVPDLVLCDLALPRLSGRGVAAKLRANARTAAVPLVALTIYEVNDDESGGFDGHITKPITVATFVDDVARYLARP